MATKRCGCADQEQGSCAACRREEIVWYWCDSCKRSVPDKRCPLCGLKTHRMKETKQG
jgi:predicted RNA-binding protein with PUA domain